MASIGLAGSSLGLASAWQGWVIMQGTNQLIQPGWWAFRYAALLLAALALAVVALVMATRRPPADPRVGLAIRVVCGLEILLFGVVWFSLVVFPLGVP
jgi:hypothetical protein